VVGVTLKHIASQPLQIEGIKLDFEDPLFFSIAAKQSPGKV
jgi:hypothetical protein